MRVNYRFCLALIGATIAAAPAVDAAERTPVKFVMDWAFEGAQSIWPVAAESGFADQAHLVREFVALAGEPSTAWARRLTLTDSRLTRPQDGSPDW